MQLICALLLLVTAGLKANIHAQPAISPPTLEQAFLDSIRKGDKAKTFLTIVLENEQVGKVLEQQERNAMMDSSSQVVTSEAKQCKNNSKTAS